MRMASISIGYEGVIGVLTPTSRPYQATPAIFGDSQLVDVSSFILGPCNDCIEISQHKLIRRFGDDLFHQLGHSAIRSGIALPHEQFRRQRQKTLLGEAARDVGDM